MGTKPLFLAKLGLKHLILVGFSAATQEKGSLDRCKLCGTSAFLLPDRAPNILQSLKWYRGFEGYRFRSKNNPSVDSDLSRMSESPLFPATEVRKQ